MCSAQTLSAIPISRRNISWRIFSILRDASEASKVSWQLAWQCHELFKLSTYQNPYPEGKIGVLEAGSFADILIVNGNPAEDLDVLSVQDNMLFIMKNAKVYKNRL